jgi:F420-dependent oxidoreductase-like protein
MNEVGIVLSSDYFPSEKMIELAPMIDQLGYAQISVPEIWGHDAFSLLSILAYRTKRPRLATGIVNIFSRSPATMAMTAASIDELSNGRFILGLGVSGPKVIEDWHGIPFQKPLTRTREYIEVLRAIFAKQRLNKKTSQLGTFSDFRISIKEVRPDLPIHIASLGPKNIQLTAEMADGWIPVIMPLDSFDQQVAEFKRYVESAQRSPDHISITPFVPTLVGSSEEVVQTLKGHLAYYFGGMGDFYNNMLARFGFEQEAEEIKTRWNSGDIRGASQVIHEELLDAIAIHGSPDHALEQLVRFRKAGATCPLLMLPFRSTLEQAMTTYQTLAPSNEQM